jgi:hypothetical protein
MRFCRAIAHRLSTIRYADCIYVMEWEKIEHEDLLEKQGIYAQLGTCKLGKDNSSANVSMIESRIILSRFKTRCELTLEVGKFCK